MESARPVLAKWNRTAVPTVAVMFLVAAVVPGWLFATPRTAFSVVAAWFLVACAVQFWGSRSDRVIAIVALVVMVAAAFLPLMLGTSTNVEVGVTTNSGIDVTRQP